MPLIPPTEPWPENDDAIVDPFRADHCVARVSMLLEQSEQAMSQGQFDKAAACATMAQAYLALAGFLREPLS